MDRAAGERLLSAATLAGGKQFYPGICHQYRSRPLLRDLLSTNALVTSCLSIARIAIPLRATPNRDLVVGDEPLA
jgi:hypothetical protein